MPVKFSSSNTGWQQLDPYHHGQGGKIPGLGFMDRMKLMIRWSDNTAAGSCVHAVGFQYMNSALAADGFADNKANGILWLGGDFGLAPSWASRPGTVPGPGSAPTSGESLPSWPFCGRTRR